LPSGAQLAPESLLVVVSARGADASVPTIQMLWSVRLFFTSGTDTV
jgi:hypothetical protein